MMVAAFVASVISPSAVVAASLTYTVPILDDTYVVAALLSQDGIHHIVLRGASAAYSGYYMTDRGNRWTITPVFGYPKDLALAADGRVYFVTLTHGLNNDPNVRLYTVDNGEVSGEEVVGYGQLGTSFIPDVAALAVGTDGTVHVAWSVSQGAGAFVRSKSPAGWGETKLLTEDVPSMYSMAVAVDGTDTAHLLVSGRVSSSSPPNGCGFNGYCTVDIVMTSPPVVTGFTDFTGATFDVMATPEGAIEGVLASGAELTYVTNAGIGWQTEPIVAANTYGASFSHGPAGPAVIYSLGDNSGIRRGDRGSFGWAITTVSTFGVFAFGDVDGAGRSHVAYTAPRPGSNGSAFDSFLLSPDTLAPTVGRPRAAPKIGAVAGSTIPVVISWAAFDAISGLSTFQIQESVDGHPWAIVGSALTSKSITRSLTPATATYAYRVRGVDKAGNTSGYVAGPNVALQKHEETSASLVYSGTWPTQASSLFSGGAARYATSTSAAATVTFTGRGFAWVGTYGPSRGSANIWVDGNLVATVNTNRSSATYRPIIWSTSWTSSGTHTIGIRPAGTATTPRIDLDALVVISDKRGVIVGAMR
jgi:hypothetical protein